MAETVPDDVILRILPELPAKSLLRFKSVCKTWYSTISDPEFCNKLHRKRLSVLICENSRKFSTITIESLLSTTKNKKAPTPLSLPWEPKLWGENHLIGSCNGMVCVHHIGRLNEFILWNPSTRQFRRLPRCHYVLKEGYYSHYVWFGYDESIQDYKIVWLKYFPLSHAETKLYVFTLKSNTWTRTEGPSERGLHPSGFEGPSVHSRILGVLSGGAIHWRAFSPHTRRRVIVALDLATEKFEVLNFSNYPFDPRRGGSCLVGGRGRSCNGLCLQIVKEYGRERTLRSKWKTTKSFPILFSSGKEILALLNNVRLNRPEAKDMIMKFRIEEGGEKVSYPGENMLNVPSELPNRNSIVLHMEESLVYFGIPRRMRMEVPSEYETADFIIIWSADEVRRAHEVGREVIFLPNPTP